MPDLTFHPITGCDVEPYVDDLARLRITVFREFPYLYDGDLDYEHRYIRTYSESPESLFVLAMDGEKVVGVSTGVPMEHEGEAFRGPFVEHGYDIAKLFYFGESVLLKEYRGRGAGVRFFVERETYAEKLGRFEYTAFCAVDRSADHPRRPADYAPLDKFWQRRGYTKHPELRTSFTWLDLDDTEPTSKPMTFWLKKLGEE